MFHGAAFFIFQTFLKAIITFRNFQTLSELSDPFRPFQKLSDPFRRSLKVIGRSNKCHDKNIFMGYIIKGFRNIMDLWH